jgi:SET domain-containing protein
VGVIIEDVLVGRVTGSKKQVSHHNMKALIDSVPTIDRGIFFNHSCCLFHCHYLCDITDAMRTLDGAACPACPAFVLLAVVQVITIKVNDIFYMGS